MTTDRRSTPLPDHLFFAVISGACALAFAAYLAVTLTPPATVTASPAAVTVPATPGTTGSGSGS